MADSKVTDLALATTPLSGTEVVYLVQGGLDTQATAQDIANLGGGGSGDVVGPASATDNAIARYDGITGKLIQDSAVTIADTGATTITSAAAAALAVGPNGATNPALRVKGDVASSASGWEVIPTSGAAVRWQAISSSPNCEAIISAQGTGACTITSGSFCTMQINGNNVFSSSQNSMQFNPVSGQRSFTSNVTFRFFSVASTNIPAGVDTPSAFFDFGQIQQHSTGALALQRDFRIRPSTHSFVAASTLTDAYGAFIDGAPIAGTNATVTRSTTLGLGGSAVGAGTVTSYGLWALPNTGATNNFAARFDGAIDLNGAGAGTAGQVLTSGGAGASPTWSSAGGGGISRSVNVISTNTTAGSAANTDYVYICTGTIDVTLPTASGNTNQYVIKNNGTGVITIVGTVDGAANPALTTQYESITLVSNGTDWSII